MSQHVELSNSLIGVSSNSTELSSIEDPVSFLLETEELKNRKPKAFQEKKKATVFKLDSDTLRKLACNNNLNRLTWSRLKFFALQVNQRST